MKFLLKLVFSDHCKHVTNNACKAVYFERFFIKKTDVSKTFGANRKLRLRLKIVRYNQG